VRYLRKAGIMPGLTTACCGFARTIKLRELVEGRTADGAAAHGITEGGVVDGAPPQLARLLHAHVPVCP